MLATAASLAGPKPGTSVHVLGGTPIQREMVRWAVGRFDAAGLNLPQLEVRFHPDREGCRGRLGYYAEGVVDVCRRHMDLWASREMVHELAHGWVAANLTDADRARFLALRGLVTWNDDTVPWEGRGFEHAAEIIAWAIGDQADGIYMPSIPDNEHPQLSLAYRALTSRRLPTLTPADLWALPE